MISTSTVLLFNHNNYFNRQVKPDPYVSGPNSPIMGFPGINFDFNDGINTKLILNMSDELNPDYVEVLPSGMTEDFDPSGGGGYQVTSNGRSNWFVIEQRKTRGGQYELTLRRDVVRDYYNDVIEAPCFIRKGTLQPNDPLIFNSENMTYNQIKKSEWLLKDSTECGWIVGYYTEKDKWTEAMQGTITGYNIIDIDLSTWKYKNNTVINSGTPNTYLKLATISNLAVKYSYFTNKGTQDPQSGVYYNNRVTETVALSGGYGLQDSHEILNTKYEYINKTLTNGVDLQNYNHWELLTVDRYGIDVLLSQSYYQNFAITTAGVFDLNDEFNDIDPALGLKSSIIHNTADGKYYKYKIQGTGTTININAQAATSDSTYIYLNNTLRALPGARPTSNSPIFVTGTAEKGYILLEEVTVSSSINIPAITQANQELLQDAPYYAFAIPCPAPGGGCTYGGISYDYNTSMAIAQLLARKLQPQQAGGALLDLQLLPYKPPIKETPVMGHVYDSNNHIIGNIYRMLSSSFDGEIEFKYNVTDTKIENETDLWRLTSPNFASSYDFSAAKNRGIDGFHFNCTYKPHTPYINIHLKYAGLYGYDFDDNRGLVCSGDYSLPVMSNAWETYQIQNKNYSAIFDRQMQNMDFNNAWQMAEGITGAIGGVAQGAAMGAMAGPAGAIAGAAVGAVGGALDIAKTASTQKENKSMAQDMFGYQLGNIKAKPNSLVKTSAFDIVNRVWPILELFSCTDEEKEALRMKLRYNGMTVMRIDKIKNYISHGEECFVQGDIIRLENLKNDNHMANAIYEEIAKGLYFI